MKKLFLLLFCISFLSAQDYVIGWTWASSLPAVSKGKRIILSSDSSMWRSDGVAWFHMGYADGVAVYAFDTTNLHYVKLALKWSKSDLDTANRWAPKGNYGGGIDTNALHYVKFAQKWTKTDLDTNNLHFVKFSQKQATIPNIIDSAKYFESTDSIRLFAGKLGGWTELQRTADTSTALFNAGTTLGELQFTMTASGVYEIDGRIYFVRSNAANAYTLGLNCGGTPTNVGITFDGLALTTDGTDSRMTGNITTGIDSIVLTATTLTTREYVDVKGTLTCDGSNRLFAFRYHPEVTASAVTISRGSWIRYRRLY